MIDPRAYLSFLLTEGVAYAAGVPDSLLEPLCAHIDALYTPQRHIIAANEGNAIGIASGYHLGSGRIPLVYFQNSGLGNAVNPLVSLADPVVYSIPLLLLIGWRGEPGVHDEPQHIKQGSVTSALLDALGIPYVVLAHDLDGAKTETSDLLSRIRKESRPGAMLVRSGTFEKVPAEKGAANAASDLSRERALEILLEAVGKEDAVVCSTGKASRELFELREKRGEGHGKDFLTVGSMGHASSIALGLSESVHGRTIWCIDGDGSALMHMGSIPVIGKRSPRNLVHILLNNHAHESVGGQPTAGDTVDFVGIAQSSGYRKAYASDSEASLRKMLEVCAKEAGPVFLEIRIKQGSRKDLGRPTRSPKENKADFKQFLRKE